MPIYLRPYMLFSFQTPYASQVPSGSEPSDDAELVLGFETVVGRNRILGYADNARARLFELL